MALTLSSAMGLVIGLLPYPRATVSLQLHVHVELRWQKEVFLLVHVECRFVKNGGMIATI